MREDNHRTINAPPVSAPAAKAILRVMPLVMRTLRTEMRACRAIPLSVPQFRALYFISRHPDTSLSDVATHVGVALPSMSRLVDGLVERKLVIRRGHAGDRRRLTLQLTGRGQTLVQAAHAFTEASIALRLSALDEEDLAVVVRAMGLLYPVFAGNNTPASGLRAAGRKSNGETHV